MGYKVIEYSDKYRDDILKKYGAENYSYYGDYSMCSVDYSGEFETKEAALKFAEEEFKNMGMDDLVVKSGNNLYFQRIDVVSEDETISSFGFTLEDYERYLNNLNEEEKEDYEFEM